MPAGLARLEITFRVDADGILSVHAKETTTGLEQTVTVKPSYGLDDETVERMLTEALDYGEEDLLKRRVAEGRVESERILLATRKSIEADGDLLEKGERAAIEGAMRALEESCKGEDPRKIQSGIDELDRQTKGFAGRRMNRAIARAIGGRRWTRWIRKWSTRRGSSTRTTRRSWGSEMKKKRSGPPSLVLGGVLAWPRGTRESAGHAARVRLRASVPPTVAAPAGHAGALAATRGGWRNAIDHDRQYCRPIGNVADGRISGELRCPR